MKKDDEDNPVQGYLNEKWNSIANQAVKQTVMTQAEEKLGLMKQQIEEDHLHIAQVPKNIERKSTPPPPQISAQDRLKEIITRKEQMIKRLNQISLEESKIKESTRHSPQPAPKPKSQITPEDLQTLKSLNSSYRKFQRELQRKTKQYEEKQKQFRQEEKELEQSQRLENSKNRRDQITARLEVIRNNQQQRQLRKAEEEKIFQELKSKRALHLKLEERFSEQQEQQKQKLKHLQEEARKQKEVDFVAIKSHQKSYDDLLNRQRIERANKIAEIEQQNQERAGKYPLSKFFTIIQEQQQQQSEHNKSKNKLPKINFEKKMKYAERVKNQILPNIKLRYKDTDKQQENKKEMRSLSVHQLNEKGNEYMQQAKNLIKKTEEDKPVAVKAQPTMEVYKHKNYLAQLKMNRTNRGEKSELQKVKAMMDSDSVSEDKLYKAKMLANKMEQTAGGSSRKLMDSIRAKIEILSKLS